MSARPRWHARLWPGSLYGRLVLILVIGMFGGQLLTGTIWFEAKNNRTLEIPVRLFASRLADTVRLLQAAPDARARRAITDTLGDARYRLQWIAAPAAAPADSPASRAVGDLLAGVIRRRLGEPIEVRLLSAELHDEDGHHNGILSLFNSRMPTGDFHIQLRLPQGPWLDVQANEGQAGMQSEPGALVLDYLIRVYLVRLAAVLLLALVAVRFAVRPLRQLARAAERLGDNLYREPLAVAGPREVRSAAESLNTMQAQLTQTIAARTRFLSAVSHDLRSPITRLRLRTEMLPDALWRERLRGDLDDMEATVRAALSAVQGVEITEPRHKIDLDSMLEGLAEDAREAGHRVSITGHTRGPYTGYPRNLKRCLQNVLDNAILYGGEAAIRIADDGRMLRIVISDRGPGIADPALLEKVFEPYFRIAAHARDGSAGTGLGLTIARSVAQAHGGTVQLQNLASAGLAATLSLPRA